MVVDLVTVILATYIRQVVGLQGRLLSPRERDAGFEGGTRVVLACMRLVSETHLFFIQAIVADSVALGRLT